MTLDTDIILSVCKWLGEIGYSERFIFSVYNETMIDPRLFWLNSQIGKLVPLAYLRCLSNGWYLNQHMVDLLWRFGVKGLHMTAYSDEDHRRFESWKIPAGMDVMVVPTYGATRKLDIRRRDYDLPTQVQRRAECYMPFSHLLIRATGQVGFCCLDWDNRRGFANLHDKPLKEILAIQEMLDAFKAVYEGPRKPYVCQRCYWGEIIP